MIRLYVKVDGLEPDIPFEQVDLFVTFEGHLIPNSASENTSQITNVVFLVLSDGMSEEQYEVVRKLSEENEVEVPFSEN